jgi:hypothetical protein
MKVILILAIVLVVAATALSYGHVGVHGGVTAVAAATAVPGEPATLLLSGGRVAGSRQRVETVPGLTEAARVTRRTPRFPRRRSVYRHPDSPRVVDVIRRDE